MKIKSLLAVAATLVLGSTAAWAERWTVTEGQRGEWRGVWNLNASSGDFRVILRSGDAQVTADGFYIRSGNVVSIARTRTSDGNDCHYMGTINGNALAGTMYCASGGPYRWNAVINDHPGPGDFGPQRPPQR